jgi:hypothetical protein
MIFSNKKIDFLRKKKKLFGGKIKLPCQKLSSSLKLTKTIFFQSKTNLPSKLVKSDLPRSNLSLTIKAFLKLRKGIFGGLNWFFCGQNDLLH